MKNIYIIIAKQIVEEAGRIIREARKSNSFTYEFKEDGTPLTTIDIQVQEYMAKRLKDSFDIQVMGEERSDDIDLSKPYWAIDPIDGTWAFITHENTSAINLSLIDKGEVIVGIIYNPFTNEFFHTEKETKAFIGMSTLPLRTNNAVTVVNVKPFRRHPILKSVNQLFKENKVKKLVSIGGSIAYSMCMVAKGAFSNYIAHYRTQTNAWDISAAILIIRNSGGLVTDLEGTDIDPIHHRGYLIVSADQKSHDDFLTMIRPLITKYTEE